MKKWIAALLTTFALSGCVVFLVGGAAMGLWIGSDPRSADVINSDFDLHTQLETKVRDTYKERAHVNVSVFNGLTLLTGEVPDAAAKQQIEQFARQMKSKPRAVYNELVVAAPSPVANRVKDSNLAAQVKAAILTGTKQADALHVLVVAERQVIYLMGMSKPSVIDGAAKASSKVDEVKQVVLLVEIEPEAPADKK